MTVAGQLARWQVGFPAADSVPGDGVIAFTADQLPPAAAASASVLGLHEAMRPRELPRAAAVRVRLPAYRGKALLAVLSWLVTERLAVPDAEVAWLLDKRQGPGSCQTLLTDLGWRNLRRRRADGLISIAGQPPPHAELPEPRRFTARVGSADLSFAADYGVFSPGRIDDGTMLLAEVALGHRPVPAVADIGTGYGPLAAALVGNGTAGRAVATDIDCIGLWLAERNWADNGVDVTAVCTPDPLLVEHTALTVCNVPTHLEVAGATALMRGLAGRAVQGRTLMIVVHASLERRYARHLVDAGLTIDRHEGDAHVVLTGTA
jgi:16S rRNA G1207 methylase RsmC